LTEPPFKHHAQSAFSVLQRETPGALITCLRHSRAQGFVTHREVGAGKPRFAGHFWTTRQQFLHRAHPQFQPSMPRARAQYRAEFGLDAKGRDRFENYWPH
jgi:hypothetical protein